MNDLGFDAFYIELIEECPCDNLEQLLRTEGKYIRQMASLNKIVSGQTKKEYYDNNIGYILEHKKEYYKQNKERENKRCNAYREKNKEEINETRRNSIYTCGCGSCIRSHTKARHERSNKHTNWVESIE